MKQDHTDITVVLDRSGSMSSVASDTIGGFNTFLEEQHKAPGTASITLNQFDDVYERVIDHQPIGSAQPLTNKTFVPRGSTALLDAIGKSIIDTGKRLEATSDNERPAKVVMVILTDGQENASREFDAHKVADMIREQRDKYAWEFVFIGANQDAITTAANIGIGAANAMTYANNAVGTSQVFAAAASNMVSYRSGKKRSMAWSDDQRAEQRAAGAK